MKYKSCVEWPEGSVPAIQDYSEVTHDSLAEAEAVITMLKNDGFGGDGKLFPVDTGIVELTELNILAERIYNYSSAKIAPKIVTHYGLADDIVQELYQVFAQFHLDNLPPRT